MPHNPVPALVVWCNAWTMEEWQKLTGQPRPPRFETPAFQAWKSSLTNLATIEEVHASLDKQRSKEVSVINGLITKCLNKCGLWDIIAQFMIDRSVDAASIAIQTESRSPPLTFGRWLAPHVNTLGLSLFGSEAKQSKMSNVLNDRAHAVASELLRISFERQSKLLQYSAESFQVALLNLQACLHGTIYAPLVSYCTVHS